MNPLDLSENTAKKERLDTFRPLPPALVTNLYEWFKIELTFNSNAIEGNTLTRSETALVVEKGLTVRGKPFKDHAEAINHAEAIDYVEGLVQTGGRQEIKRSQLYDIHRLILKGIDEGNAGRLRTVPIYIRGVDVELPQPYMLEKMMEDFFFWLDTEHSEHPVIIAANAHHRLVTIHPFIDGNGRTARLLMNLLLMQAGYPPALIRKEDRNPYIESIGHAQTTGEMEAYYAVVMRAIDRSLDIYLKAIDPEKQPTKYKPPKPFMKLLRIGELARLTGETVFSIRHWSDEGLLDVAHVTDTGYRYYHPSMVDRVKEIRDLQGVERLSLPEIKQRLDQATEQVTLPQQKEG